MAYGYGSGVARALKRHGLTVAEAATVMGYKAPGMVYKILRDDADPSLEALQRLADHINEPVGDLLPNSGRAVFSDELRDILAAISGVAGDDREQIISALAVNARVLANAYRRVPAPAQNVVDFPSPARTEPRWTEEFPVDPNDFVEGDFDYPLELHALEVEEFEVAAGATGVNPEVDMAAYTLHARDVRDATHRVIKVKGDSMSPDYEEGWKLLVDTKKRAPRAGDPVAVYLKDEGSVLGYWSPAGDHVELEKANAAYRPIRLGDPGTWHLIGTVQKVVDAPAKRKRRAR